MSASTLAVNLAVVLLPRGMRDRYREQWNSDLRDAAEAGIRPSEIALGALAFASTLERPLPWSGRTVTPVMVEGRSRVAFAFALSAALLALSQFARDPFYSNNGGNTVFEFVMFFMTELLTVFGVVALISALVIVTVTRGTESSVRTAVWLLVGACLTPFAALLVDGLAFSHEYFSLWWPAGLGTVVYVLGAVIAAAAVRVYWLWSRSVVSEIVAPKPRNTARGAIAGTVVLATGGVTFAHAMSLWAGRRIPVWSWEPWVSGSGMPPVLEEIIPTVAMYEEWLAQNAAFEQLVVVIFVAWGAINVALAIIVALIAAQAQGIRPALLVVWAVSAQLIGHGAVTAFLHSAVSDQPDVAPQSLILLGRIGLVAVVLCGVGGVRLEPRTRRSVEEPVAS